MKLVGPRLLVAISVLVVTLAMLGVCAPSALGTTPTTMSWMTTIPDPAHETTAATAIGAATSIPVPDAIETGGGGAAEFGGGLWILAALAAGLGGGVCISAFKLRRENMRRF